MANGNGLRRPVVHFEEDQHKQPKHTTVLVEERGRNMGSRQESQESREESFTAGRCSNKLFLAILLSVCVLVLGAVAITLILVLTRDKEGAGSTPSRQIVVFGDDHCLDMANNCAENRELCTNEFYKGMMAIYCRKSCGHCPAIPAPAPVCADRTGGYTTRCQSWKRNGFCDSLFYPESTKREYCAKTCALC